MPSLGSTPKGQLGNPIRRWLLTLWANSLWASGRHCGGQLRDGVLNVPRKSAPLVKGALPQNCHSEERGDEESGAGLTGVSLDPPPQTPRGIYPEHGRRTRGDMLPRLLRQSLVKGALPQNCHSEERSDEESGAGLTGVSLDPPPQTPR